ncbi:unnamed protein product [Plutella xylostella]|uniref:(diamondback moth) hypothetical protein n=1 Tax=Plutella xylostella TaxID=51655 RepID=A0A8S4FM95_PLUXY|nr:unnamed protein product [Plutella xylostella]
MIFPSNKASATSVICPKSCRVCSYSSANAESCSNLSLSVLMLFSMCLVSSSVVNRISGHSLLGLTSTRCLYLRNIFETLSELSAFFESMLSSLSSFSEVVKSDIMMVSSVVLTLSTDCLSLFASIRNLLHSFSTSFTLFELWLLNVLTAVTCLFKVSIKVIISSLTSVISIISCNVKIYSLMALIRSVSCGEVEP